MQIMIIDDDMPWIIPLMVVARLGVINRIFMQIMIIDGNMPWTILLMVVLRLGVIN